MDFTVTFYIFHVLTCFVYRQVPQVILINQLLSRPRCHLQGGNLLVVMMAGSGIANGRLLEFMRKLTSVKMAHMPLLKAV